MVAKQSALRRQIVQGGYAGKLSTYGPVNTMHDQHLAKTAHPKLLRFDTNYLAYVEGVEDISAVRPANQIIKAASILNPKFLHSLCILNLMKGASKGEEATEEPMKN